LARLPLEPRRPVGNLGGASLLLERGPHGAKLRVRVPGAFTGERVTLRAVVERACARAARALCGLRFAALRERERAASGS
jgi:hypothetical protein